MRTKSTGGFTLIELLIVIAIIGILAAVLIPNLMNARQTASLRAAQAHSSTLYTAAMAALAEDISAVPSDITIASCNAGGAVLVATVASPYTVNPTPGGSTCTLTGNATDVQAVVTHTATGAVYTNGVETTAP